MIFQKGDLRPFVFWKKADNAAMLRRAFVGRGHARNPQSSLHSLRGTPRVPPAQKRCYFVPMRTVEDACPYKLTFDLPLVVEGFPLPLGNDVTLGSLV